MHVDYYMTDYKLVVMEGIKDSSYVVRNDVYTVALPPNLSASKLFHTVFDVMLSIVSAISRVI